MKCGNTGPAEVKLHWSNLCKCILKHTEARAGEGVWGHAPLYGEFCALRLLLRPFLAEIVNNVCASVLCPGLVTEFLFTLCLHDVPEERHQGASHTSDMSLLQTLDKL